MKVIYSQYKQRGALSHNRCWLFHTSTVVTLFIQVIRLNQGRYIAELTLISRRPSFPKYLYQGMFERLMAASEAI